MCRPPAGWPAGGVIRGPNGIGAARRQARARAKARAALRDSRGRRCSAERFVHTRPRCFCAPRKPTNLHSQAARPPCPAQPNQFTGASWLRPPSAPVLRPAGPYLPRVGPISPAGRTNKAAAATSRSERACVFDYGARLRPRSQLNHCFQYRRAPMVPRKSLAKAPLSSDAILSRA